MSDKTRPEEIEATTGTKYGKNKVKKGEIWKVREDSRLLEILYYKKRPYVKISRVYDAGTVMVEHSQWMATPTEEITGMVVTTAYSLAEDYQLIEDAN